MPLFSSRCPRFWNLLESSGNLDAHDQETQQQENHATADRRGSKSLSEQQGSKCTHQSQQSIMLYKITHDQSTSSPEED